MDIWQRIDAVLHDPEQLCQFLLRESPRLLEESDYSISLKPGQLHPLHKAIRLGYIRSAKALATKTNIEYVSENGRDAMGEACVQNNTELLKLFFNVCETRMCPPYLMQITAQKNNVQMGKFLLRKFKQLPLYLNVYCKVCDRLFDMYFAQIAMDHGAWEFLQWFTKLSSLSWLQNPIPNCAPHDEVSLRKLSNKYNACEDHMLKYAIENHNIPVTSIRLLLKAGAKRYNWYCGVDQLIESTLLLIQHEDNLDALYASIHSSTEKPENSAIQFMNLMLYGHPILQSYVDNLPCSLLHFLIRTAFCSTLRFLPLPIIMLVKDYHVITFSDLTISNVF